MTVNLSEKAVEFLKNNIEQRFTANENQDFVDFIRKVREFYQTDNAGSGWDVPPDEEDEALKYA